MSGNCKGCKPKTKIIQIASVFEKVDVMAASQVIGLSDEGVVYIEHRDELGNITGWKEYIPPLTNNENNQHD